jgi:hypothetical protein
MRADARSPVRAQPTHEISANLPDGALSVIADLGSAFADSNATEEVFRLVRSRV